MGRSGPPPARDATICLGVSACLLGHRVRFDGGHKLDPFLTKTLGRYVEWVPVCPEVGIGLGVPRESLRLVGNATNPRLLASRSRQDHTDAMEAWAEEWITRLAHQRLHGFVLKKGSPSCGLERVSVYGDGPVPVRRGQGCFARELINRLPCLPLEDEGRLHDLRLRESFVERIFAYRRWHQMLEASPTPAGLVEFHARERLALLAHSPRYCRQIERLVARTESLPWEALVEQYGCLLTAALHVPATPVKHADVLQYLAHCLAHGLDRESRRELDTVIDDYRRGLVPLIVPLTLVQHHLRHHPVPDWIREQAYLNPYPKELMLRNHV